MDSTNRGDVQINNASEKGARSGEGHDDCGISLHESESDGEPGLHYDDLIPSDPETSGIPSDTKSAANHSRATQKSLRSAKRSIRPVIPVSQSRRKPSSLHTTPTHLGSSAIIKVPRYAAGISGRRSHLERDYPSSTTKRKESAMSAPLSKRSRRMDSNYQAKMQTDSESSDWAAGDDYWVNEAKCRKINQTRSTSRLSRPSQLLTSSGTRQARRSVEVLIPRPESERPRKVHQTPRGATAVLHDTGSKPPSLSTMLTNLSVHPIGPNDSGYLTALVDDPTTVGPLLKSPAAFGLTDDMTVRLTNPSIKPLPSALWLLTATISRAAQTAQSPKDRSLDSKMGSPSDDGTSDHSERSSRTAHSIHHYPSDSETDRENPQITRGRWSKEEDEKLRNMKQNGDPWREICREFPDRTQGAVKARWYIVLHPQCH